MLYSPWLYLCLDLARFAIDPPCFSQRRTAFKAKIIEMHKQPLEIFDGRCLNLETIICGVELGGIDWSTSGVAEEGEDEPHEAR